MKAKRATSAKDGVLLGFALGFVFRGLFESIVRIIFIRRYDKKIKESITRIWAHALQDDEETEKADDSIL